MEGIKIKILNDISKKEVYKFGIVYIAIMTIVAAFLNYFTWHSKAGILAFIFSVILWIAFYVPIHIFIKRADWRISDFGFVVNKRSIITSVVLVTVIMIKSKSSGSFMFGGYTILEAFARVGEEAFYRGFIYTLSLKLFKEKQNSWLWALLTSSIMFTIIHTQTFLPDNSINMLSIFINALILLGLLRCLTGSILPAIIIHCASNGGILCMFFGILIYVVILIIAYLINNKKIGTKYLSANDVD